MRHSSGCAALTVILMFACTQVPVRDMPAGAPDTVPAAGPRAGMASPAPWSRRLPAFGEFGIRIVEAPRTAEVGSTALFVAACGPDIELRFSVSYSGPPKPAGTMTRLEVSGGEWRFRLAFPSSGEYRVILAARRKGPVEGEFSEVADWSLRAEVKLGEAASLPETARPAPPSAPAAAPAPPRDPKADLGAALAGRDIPGLRGFLAACAEGERGVRASRFAALTAVLFEPDHARTPEIRGLLAAAGLDPNLAHPDGAPLLFFAVAADRMDVVEWLLDRGARIDARGNAGTSVLHVLTDVYETPVKDPAAWIRFLVGRGADPDARTQEGSTPLCWVAQDDDLHALVAAFVESGADVNLGDEEGNAPLSHATQHGARKNAEYLRSRGARLYSYEFPVSNDAAACRAVLSGNPAAIAALPREDLSRMAGRTSLLVPATPLHLAAERGSLEVLKALCARKVDWNVPDRYGRSPLHLAVEAGRGDVIDLLLDHGADPNYEARPGSTPFIAALANRPDLALRMLGRRRAPRPGPAEAKAAVASGSLELVKSLDGFLTWTPQALQFAADAGYTEIAEHLASRTTPPVASPSDYAEKAGKHREDARKYRAKAEAPLAVPRKTGGIALQRGDFPYVLEGWSPWMRVESVKLSDYPVGVYVPRDYDGRTPYGLVVSMTNAKSSSRYPRDFAPVLDRRRIIWIGFDPYNGLCDFKDANPAFCLAAVHAMMTYYNIDPQRVYIGGYSLGGQMTQAVLSRHAWLFDGAFFINIPYYGEPVVSDPEWNYLKDLPVAVVEGDYDYNRSGTYASYLELRRSGYRRLQYAHEPMQGHKLISAASFERIFSLIEGDVP